MSINQEPIVQTRNGQIEGEIIEDLYVFKGIPYAAPPVGPLRWSPPQPVDPLSAVGNADPSLTSAPIVGRLLMVCPEGKGFVVGYSFEAVFTASFPEHAHVMPPLDGMAF